MVLEPEGLPTLETNRLLLRPRTLEDTANCLSLDREPGVTRYVDGPWNDEHGHRAFIEERTLGPYPPGLGYWSITRKERTASFLGWILLIPVDGVGPEVEIGWRIHPSAWGQGYASEAAAKVLAHACASCSAPDFIAEVDPENLASIRVAEKIGMRRQEGLAGHGEQVRFVYSRNTLS